MGAPHVFASFPTIAFLAPDHPRRDLDAAQAAALQLAPGERAGFCATPEHFGGLAAIRRRYPQGKGGVVYRRTNTGEVLFEYFVVDARD